MVRHIVMWNFKEEAEGHTKTENMAIIKERLEALVGQIEGLCSLNVLPNYNPNGMDLCLYSEFESPESVAYYTDHPLHVAVKEYVHKVISDRVVADCIME